MKDQTIRAGDMVMVVKPTPCCGATTTIGRTYRVNDVIDGPFNCTGCGARYMAPMAHTGDKLPVGLMEAYVLPRLIKLPPLSEPETLTHEKEVTA